MAYRRAAIRLRELALRGFSTLDLAKECEEVAVAIEEAVQPAARRSIDDAVAKGNKNLGNLPRVPGVITQVLRDDARRALSEKKGTGFADTVKFGNLDGASSGSKLAGTPARPVDGKPSKTQGSGPLPPTQDGSKPPSSVVDDPDMDTN
jgi:hypothetical protein